MRILKALVITAFFIFTACGGVAKDIEKEKIFINVNIEEMEDVLKEKNVVLLDVRTKDEYKTGHIEGSFNIDYYGEDFIVKIKALNKEKSYILYCRSGNRSYQTLKIMEEADFNKVYNLRGGILTLRTVGYPLVLGEK